MSFCIGHSYVPCPPCPRPWAYLTAFSSLLRFIPSYRITHKLLNRPRKQPTVPARLSSQPQQPRLRWVRALPVATRPVAGRAAASSRSTRRRPSLSTFSSVPTLTVSNVLSGLLYCCDAYQLLKFAQSPSPLPSLPPSPSRLHRNRDSAHVGSGQPPEKDRTTQYQLCSWPVQNF